MTRAEDIRIESDEAGFELHVLVDDWPTMTESGWMIINVHNVAPELFEQVKRVIGSWLAEGAEVKAEYDQQLRVAPEAPERVPEGVWEYGVAPGIKLREPFLCSEEDVDESAGAYDLNDPKRHGWHSVHADLWDNRDKGGRTF